MTKATTCGHLPHFGKGLCSRCYGKAWRSANPKKKAASSKAWNLANAERKRAGDRAWKQANPALHRASRQASRARVSGAPIVDLTLEQWRRILDEFDGRCAYCGTDGPIEQDHLIPLSRGGAHTAANVVPACGPCNRAKYDKTVDEFLNARPALDAHYTL